jgi:hypothetical protein
LVTPVPLSPPLLLCCASGGGSIKTSLQAMPYKDKINNNYNTSYNHYNNINLKPKVKTIAPKILAHTQMHK